MKCICKQKRAAIILISSIFFYDNCLTTTTKEGQQPVKYRTFKQEKLWRDNGVESVEKDGAQVDWRKLDDEEFIEKLKLKLIEEAYEVSVTQTKQELVQELADVLEVVASLAKASEISMHEITQAQDAKREFRGGFDNRIYVVVTQYPEDSVWTQYSLTAPTKYQEIQD